MIESFLRANKMFVDYSEVRYSAVFFQRNPSLLFKILSYRSTTECCFLDSAPG